MEELFLLSPLVLYPGWIGKGKAIPERGWDGINGKGWERIPQVDPCGKRQPWRGWEFGILIVSVGSRGDFQGKQRVGNVGFP